MSTTTRLPVQEEIEYPESDGEPMAENTDQYDWLTWIKDGLEIVFDEDPNVFVAGDLLWYPVERDNKTRRAPDVMVALGRPKGPRGSYLQWLEAGIAPQVVFEVLSPGNRGPELALKFEFYQTYGVEEYYIYDPADKTLEGWLRDGDTLSRIPVMNGWRSPRLRIRFELVDGQLQIYGPDGQPFRKSKEHARRAAENQRQVEAERRRADEQQQRADEKDRLAEEQRREAEEQRRRADEKDRLAEEQRRRADEKDRLAEEQRREAEEQRRETEEQRRRADEQQQRADRLAAHLKALGIELEP